MRVAVIGDIIGNPGRRTLKEFFPEYRKVKKLDFVIANGENAVSGSGITYPAMNELFNSGIDVITMGNHTWSKKEILSFINTEERLIRPANYPEGTPGKGFVTVDVNGIRVSVLNILGRVFLEPVDCPFRIADREISALDSISDVIIVDFHAEATSEKNAMGYYLDGRVTAVLGTHTHIQTADEKLLPLGTAFITDIGMTGPCHSVLGVKHDIIIKKFLTNMPHRFEVATGDTQLNAVIIDIDDNTYKAKSIERVFENYSF